MSMTTSPGRSPNFSQLSGAAGGGIQMADITGNSQRNSPRGGSYTYRTVVGNTTTTTTGFSTNNYDQDGLLKGASTSVTGFPDGRDYVVGSSSSGSSFGIAGGSSGVRLVRASTSTISSGGMTNQMDMRNTGARGIVSPPLGVAGPSGTSGNNISMTSTGMNSGSEFKLRRFLEHNQKLKEQLELPRIPVSEASRSLIHSVTATYDPFLPMIWGPGPDPFVKKSSKCCSIS